MRFGLRARPCKVKADRVLNKAVVAGALLALAGCGQGGTDASAPPPLSGARIGGPFALVDARGRPFTERDLLGRYSVIYFGYTNCPDVCPTDVRDIGAGLKQLEAEDAGKAARVVPVFVTVDPARDTPAAVGAFVANFHPRMVGLTGSRAAVDAAARAYAVYYKLGSVQPGGGYLVDHSRQAYLMDPGGKPVALVPADGGPAAVAETLGRWVR
jgi:protein SCO1/2